MRWGSYLLAATRLGGNHVRELGASGSSLHPTTSHFCIASSSLRPRSNTVCRAAIGHESTSRRVTQRVATTASIVVQLTGDLVRSILRRFAADGAGHITAMGAPLRPAETF